MKTITTFVFGTLCAILLFSCKKDSDTDGGGGPTLPQVSTSPVTNITATSAQCGGTVISDGGAPITARGVCWSVINLNDTKTTDGSGLGNFTSLITGLYPNRLYVVRAYATNSVGTAYGEEVGFFTIIDQSVPTLTTAPIISTNSSTLSTGGEILSNGNSAITSKGICWSTTPNPTVADNVTLNGTGNFGYSSFITGLSVNTTYYFRAYATNAVGTGYGPEISYKTKYFIGEGVGGGRIFYIDNTLVHGLVVSLNDVSGAARWNNTSNPFGPVNAYSTTNGVANTNAIISTIGSSGNAAAICRSYTGGGYSDWYLPSIDELALLAQQRSVISNLISFNYWSSTASSTDDSFAWATNFGDGTSSRDHFKTSLYFVRAVRKF